MCPITAATRKPRPRQNTRADLRRQEIVQAAIKIFSRLGFEAARADDIAQAAKMAKGTLYLYFRSKEAIYSAAIAHAIAELQAQSTESIAAAIGFHEKLHAAIAIRLQFWTEHEALYRLLLTLGREPRHRRQTNQLLRVGQQHLLGLFDEGVRSRELKKGDYSAIAWAILDMIRGATERRLDRKSESTVETDIENITTFALLAARAR